MAKRLKRLLQSLKHAVKKRKLLKRLEGLLNGLERLLQTPRAMRSVYASIKRIWNGIWKTNAETRKRRHGGPKMKENGECKKQNAQEKPRKLMTVNSLLIVYSRAWDPLKKVYRVFWEPSLDPLLSCLMMKE